MIATDGQQVGTVTGIWIDGQFDGCATAITAVYDPGEYEWVHVIGDTAGGRVTGLLEFPSPKSIVSVVGGQVGTLDVVTMAVKVTGRCPFASQSPAAMLTST